MVRTKTENGDKKFQVHLISSPRTNGSLKLRSKKFQAEKANAQSGRSGSESIIRQEKRKNEEEDEQKEGEGEAEEKRKR